MKNSSLSILVLTLSVMVSGCDSLGIPNFFSHDQVPDEAKAVPRLVETPSAGSVDMHSWPRLGDVPFKPHDFTPPDISDRYMNEMEFHRSEAEAAKATAASEDATITGVTNTAQTPKLAPPLLPTVRKE